MQIAQRHFHYRWAKWGTISPWADGGVPHCVCVFVQCTTLCCLPTKRVCPMHSIVMEGSNPGPPNPNETGLLLLHQQPIPHQTLKDRLQNWYRANFCFVQHCKAVSELSVLKNSRRARPSRSCSRSRQFGHGLNIIFCWSSSWSRIWIKTITVIRVIRNKKNILKIETALWRFAMTFDPSPWPAGSYSNLARLFSRQLDLLSAPTASSTLL